MVGVAHKLSTWGLQSDFAAMSSHPAATRSFSFLERTIGVVVVNTVVVLTQHRQIRRLRMPAVFVGVDVVNLASIGWHVAVRPRADQILSHSQRTQLVGRETRFVEIHRAGGGVKKPDIELIAQAAFHRGVDELSASHGRAIG